MLLSAKRFTTGLLLGTTIIQNETYRLESGAGGIFRLSVQSETKQADIRNVCAYVRGRDEPGRIVVLGNHVDAWSFGAIDPNSGTLL